MLRRLLALWRGPSRDTEAKTPRYDPDTVDALVEEAKYHASFEENRLSTTNQRAAWLLTVAGVILTLSANQAREMLAHSASLGPVGRPIAAIALAIGMALIVLSIVFSLIVIRQAKSWEWDTTELESLGSGSSVRRPKPEAQGTFLLGLQKRILRERQSFYRLRAGLNRAFAALAVGLVAIALHIGVYAERTIENTCPLATSTTVVARTVAPAAVPPAAAIRVNGTVAPEDESPFRPPKGCGGTR